MTLLLCLAFLVPEACMTPDRKPEARPQADLAGLDAPAVVIDSFPQYLIGFPMVVAVELRNPSATSTFLHLPTTDLRRAPGPVEFTFVSSDGKTTVLPAASTSGREDRRGLKLGPGETHRSLFDIDGLEPSLQPGTYRVVGRYRWEHGSSTAPAVDVKLVAPSAEDAKIAAALKAQNDVSRSSWAHFLDANWRTVEPPKLSDVGRPALAFHLFLHRAIYGPDPVSRLDTDAMKPFARGPLEGEAAVLRHEKLVASKQDAAALEAEILKRWPGLKWRLEENGRGLGFLSVLRRTRGPEQDFEKPPKTFPYRP